LFVSVFNALSKHDAASHPESVRLPSIHDRRAAKTAVSSLVDDRQFPSGVGPYFALIRSTLREMFMCVRLWRETEPEAVALVVGTLVTWGRESTQWSVEALGREFPSGVPG
jgi:hypothetical protein